ncbi:MAG: hypothetical protein AB7Q97_15145 [Gammaproteobacteria bacterium]
MRIGTVLRTLSLLAAGLGAAPAMAAVVYDEAAAGDLSGDRGAPTRVALAPGSNEVRGTMGFLGSASDLDYFTVTVPAGTVLTNLMLLPGSEVSVAVSFIAVQAGSTFTVAPSAPTAAGLLGWTHYTDPPAAGTDLLPAMSAPVFGSTGFAIPLAAGDYTFWVQDIDGPAAFRYDFIVESLPAPVPLPAAIPLMVSSLALLGMLPRRQGSGAARRPAR